VLDYRKFLLTCPAALAVVALTASGLPACGDPQIATGSGNGAGGHSTGSDSGIGGSSGTFNNDGGLGGSSGTLNPDAACATESVKAVITPVNMFILFDRSASMAYKSKFSQTTAALTTFFQDPGSAGLRVAFRFFPDGQDCNVITCDPVACTPPLVPLGALIGAPAPADKQEAALVSVVSGSIPDGDENTSLGTPMSAALDGAERWATAYQAAHPTEKVVVILVSDGEPHGCDKNYATLNNLAATAHAKGVSTYAVGLSGFFQSQMDAIAQNGGTGQAFFIDPQVNVAASLLADLQAIQKGTVSCALPMPTSKKGTVDPTQVIVSYTPNGGMSTALMQVNDAADCMAKGGGWYYDDPINPKTITLCPTNCATAQADANPTIDVALGCLKPLM
jgi:hypothetical protein